MSALSDLMAALRQVLTMEHRIVALREEIADLKAREQDTRERLIRLEVHHLSLRGEREGGPAGPPFSFSRSL